jgi:hypothetical protein
MVSSNTTTFAAFYSNLESVVRLNRFLLFWRFRHPLVHHPHPVRTRVFSFFLLDLLFVDCLVNFVDCLVNDLADRFISIDVRLVCPIVAHVVGRCADPLRNYVCALSSACSALCLFC